jgi:hypothetical protein
MKLRTHLIPLLAASVLAASIGKATIVFQDSFTNAPGTLLVGKLPEVGNGAWTSGGGSGDASLAVSAVNSLDTAGKSVQVFGGFTATLGVGQMVTVQCDTLVPASGTFLAGPNTSWGGISLYTGHTTGGTGSERMFFGNPSAGFWGTDGGAIGRHYGSDNTEATHVTFTYVYSSGAWSLSTSSGYATNGIGTANLALNALRVGDGSAYINVDNLTVDISPVPVFSFLSQTPGAPYSAPVSGPISVQTTDGTSPVNTNTIVMKVDGNTVTPNIGKTNNVTTISYIPVPPLTGSGALHTVLVTLAEDGGTAHTNSWSFTTGYPALPVTLAGPFATSNGQDVVIFSAAGEGWLGTNYNANSARTIYVRQTMTFLDLNGETADNQGGCYGGLHFFNGSTERLLTGETWLRNTWSVDDKLANGELSLNPLTVVVTNEWHTTVTKVTYTPGGNAAVKVWLDPDFSQTEDNQANAPLELSMDNTFDNIRLRCGDRTANAQWTNIVVGSAATDVGFAPAVAPVFQGYIPAVNAPSAYVNTPLEAQIVSGTTGIRTSDISMTLDGSPVTPSFSTAGNLITVHYQPASPFVPGSSHTVNINLTDTNGTPYGTSWSFIVDIYPTLPVTLVESTNGFPIDVSSDTGQGMTIWSAQNGWLAGNYGETSTNTLYARFTMNFQYLNDEIGKGGGFGGLHFYSGNTEVLLVGNNWLSTNWSLDDITAPDYDLTPVTPIVLGEWHTLLVKIQFVPNADDNVSVWLDPDFSKSEGSQPNAPVTFSADTSFDSIHLRCGEGSSVAEFTNIVLGATAPDVGFPAIVAPPVLNIGKSGGNVTISWTGEGKLQEAATVTGLWSDSVITNNPQSRPATNSALFFRVKQ